MNTSVRTATAFQITGGVTVKMIVVTILMKKIAVSSGWDPSIQALIQHFM